jgi:hypothetical protein
MTYEKGIFKPDDSAVEGFNILFNEPNYDLENTHIFAVDFIDRDHIREVTNVASQLTGQSNPKFHKSTINDLEFEFQRWGIWESAIDEFEHFQIQIIDYDHIHQSFVLLLLGKLSDGGVEINQMSGETLDIEYYHEILSQIWHDQFPTPMNTLLNTILSKNQRNLGPDTLVQSPLTLSSSQILVDDLGTLRSGQSSNNCSGNDANFLKKLRNREFADLFGYNPTFPMSIARSFEHTFTLLTAFHQGMVNNQLEFDRFAFYEFIDKRNERSIQSLGRNATQGVSNYPNNPPGKLVMRTIPYLYFKFYIFLVPIELDDHEERLRKQSINIDESKVEEKMELLHDFESQFYSDYIRFIDNDDSAHDLVDNYEAESKKAFNFNPVPKNLGNEKRANNTPGIFEIFTDELIEDIENLSERYERVQHRYDTITNRINRQLDLQISQINNSLSESSLQLQEDTRDLTQSSNKLQNKVANLTKWIYLLTFVMAGEVIISAIPDWIYNWLTDAIIVYSIWATQNPIIGISVNLLIMLIFIGILTVGVTELKYVYKNN